MMMIIRSQESGESFKRNLRDARGATRQPISRRQALHEASTEFGPVLYAIRYPTGTIKIGYTAHLAKRMNTLGLLNLEILAIRPNSTRSDELDVHRSLAGERHHGREYYNPTPPVMAVVNTWRADLGRPPIT